MLSKNVNETSLYSTKSKYAGRNLLSGLLFGIGLVAFIDEVVFHQLLHWHHFYDRSTTEIGLISDGLFHAFSWFATIGGLFLFADLRRRNALWLKRWIGSILLGAGLFQLYDGTVQHKIMKIHQIRYVDNVIVYDIVWNSVAGLLIVIGAILVFQTRRKANPLKGMNLDD
ncbi:MULTISPECIES: DUF2243 domain-containing protein [Oceanobacillus]|uniref:DUF2243 domain-containing protein n=1 Tax=Oceanobacillus TaxID=182709 RepID=UPI00084E63A4|nr:MULTISPECIES: DUF2243 domain-containing protein [Oceanobacillus]MBT2599332.1 DUF2243 domain-containing protein [Oceanobacillus sp. ISL-74]MBT2652250.1 DUF2243 domain-containing protein [Oceanobacillus sp. ISL-73]MCT1578471.1 DUF2243 domain-containing protein [Oceanobacillus kimchii]MCT2136480.1 DUF2243 domain-containing protein [Oceanobacillus kimchii]OEH54758.1 hypothetical protein AQ616_10125 [Oceanobacillus sp. E9]